MDTNFMILNPGEPTFLGESGRYSNIDLTITDNNLAIKLTWDISSELYNSDHFPIFIESDLTVQSPSQKQKRWCLQSAK